MSQNSNSKEGIDYYDALFGETAVTIDLEDGGRVELRRAGLGRHFALMKIQQATREAMLDDRVDLLRKWLMMLGLDLNDKIALEDIPTIVHTSVDLNTQRGRPAWQLVDRTSEGVPHEKLSNYVGRELAYIVHTLAKEYGWTLEHILELQPEVALAHVQECLVSQHKERSWTHFLSEVAWEYDKGSNSSRYKPLPPIEWDIDLGPRRQPSPISDRIRERYYPKGVIIDFTNPDAIKELGQARSRTAGDEAP